MSFRQFVYYCALCGAWAAFIGWLASRFVVIAESDSGTLLRCLDTGVKGLLLGFFIALALSLVDAAWNVPLSRVTAVAKRVVVAVLVGMVGGFIGGFLGEALRRLLGPAGFIGHIFGWTLAGILIGASVAAYDFFRGLAKKRNLSGAKKKLAKTVIGGSVGGIVGGVVSLAMIAAWSGVFAGKDPDALLSPFAWGFVALGLCIGLLVGLAQVVLREAWVRVEEGFRPGREKLLTKDLTTIGRAEACDIGLFGDPGTEKLHARILHVGSRYYLEDVGTPGGTYVNERKIQGRQPLHAGDRIRVGRNILRFQVREKRAAPGPPAAG